MDNNITPTQNRAQSVRTPSPVPERPTQVQGTAQGSTPHAEVASAGLDTSDVFECAATDLRARQPATTIPATFNDPVIVIGQLYQDLSIKDKEYVFSLGRNTPEDPKMTELQSNKLLLIAFAIKTGDTTQYASAQADDDLDRWSQNIADLGNTVAGFDDTEEGALDASHVKAFWSLKDMLPAPPTDIQDRNTRNFAAEA